MPGPSNSRSKTNKNRLEKLIVKQIILQVKRTWMQKNSSKIWTKTKLSPQENNLTLKNLWNLDYKELQGKLKTQSLS